MANRNRRTHNGEVFRKLDSITYIGRKYYETLRKWHPVLPHKGNLKLWHKAGLR